MPSDNSARRSSSTDLVAELHNQKQASALQIERDKRRRRRRGIITVVVSVVVVAALGVAGKLAWDHHRAGKARASATTHLAAGTAEDLVAAVAQLDVGLGIAPQDPDSLALLAMVRAHQAIAATDAELMTEVLDRLDGAETSEVALAQGVAAAIGGDLKAVDETLGKVHAGSDDPPQARVRGWLHGTSALAKPFQADKTTAAVAELQTVVETDGWAPAHRMLIALLIRAGKIDDAKAQLEVARQANPADFGIAADEALIHALLSQHTGGVVEVAKRLLAEDSLAPRDRGRVHLARALVAIDDGEPKDADKDLAEAWKSIPPWDRDSRALALDAALAGGQIERAKQWSEALEADETTTTIYAAWLQLVDGDVVGALKACAELPQTHPRVAYVQALALAEQKRFTESGPWIERAQAAYGPRVELRVAAARTAAHAGDPKAAAKDLAAIAEEHTSPRAYTALGEALLLVAGDDGDTGKAEKALRKAIDREERPAEAAFLLANLVKKTGDDEPDKIPEAIELLEKAAELGPKIVRYRAALGSYLAQHGDLAEAEKVLRTLVDDELTPADALLSLAAVSGDRAELGHAKVDLDEVGKWLDTAAKRGGDPVRIALVRARAQLASGDEALLPTVVTEAAAALTANPKHNDLRIVHGEALRRQKDYLTARATLRQGASLTKLAAQGELFLARAAVERSDGSDRLAASLAWKGWERIVQADMPANRRILLGRQTAEYWEAIDNRAVQRSISKSIVSEMPWRADAWAFRALTQLADDKNDEGCVNAKKALKMDDKLAEAHAASAECWISKHRYADARKDLATAIKLASSEVEKRRYKRRLRILR